MQQEDGGNHLPALRNKNQIATGRIAMTKPADGQIAKARESKWYDMLQRAKKVATEMVADNQRGRHRIDYYALKLREFAASERQAVIEECAKIADRIRMNGISTPREAAEHIARAIRSME